jgi:hypothetical protein
MQLMFVYNSGFVGMASSLKPTLDILCLEAKMNDRNVWRVDKKNNTLLHKLEA